MKKVMLMLVSAVMFLSLLSCQNIVVSDTSVPDNVKIPENMDPALAMKILEDSWQWTLNQNPWMDPETPNPGTFKDWLYYGNYNGCEIVRLGEDQSLWKGSMWLEFGDTAAYIPDIPTYAYIDSNFYGIYEAYSKGLLTETDIRSISWQWQ